MEAMKQYMNRVAGMLAAIVALAGVVTNAGSAAAVPQTSTRSQIHSARVDETLRLRANRGYSRPGGGVQVRIENDTTSEVAYGFQYELALRKNGAWVKLPTRPVFSPRLFLRPESVSAWQKITVPKKANPGRYRIRKQVEMLLGQKNEKRQLDATFRVSGS
jgi:hypothetical protein